MIINLCGGSGGGSSAPIKLQGLIARENGTYTPDEGYDGYSEVLVDVPVNDNSDNYEPYVKGLLTEKELIDLRTGISSFTYIEGEYGGYFILKFDGFIGVNPDTNDVGVYNYNFDGNNGNWDYITDINSNYLKTTSNFIIDKGFKDILNNTIYNPQTVMKYQTVNGEVGRENMSDNFYFYPNNINEIYLESIDENIASGEKIYYTTDFDYQLGSEYGNERPNDLVSGNEYTTLYPRLVKNGQFVGGGLYELANYSPIQLNTALLDNINYQMDSYYDKDIIITNNMYLIDEFNPQSAIHIYRNWKLDANYYFKNLDVWLRNTQIGFSNMNYIQGFHFKHLYVTGVESTSYNTLDYSYLFSNCSNLREIIIDDFEMKYPHNKILFYGAFKNCRKLKKIEIPYNMTERATDIGFMFENCEKLETIPPLNTSLVKNAYSLFFNCLNLKSIPLMDCGNITNTFDIFYYPNMTALTDIGGFVNLKADGGWYFISNLKNLTVQSLMNIINNLFDWTDYPDGKAPLNDGTIHNFGTNHSLKFGTINLGKLTPEQIAVATAKGWTLTA